LFFLVKLITQTGQLFLFKNMPWLNSHKTYTAKFVFSNIQDVAAKILENEFKETRPVYCYAAFSLHIRMQEFAEK